MVPVPEELVDEVRRYVDWNLSAPAAEVDNPNALEEVIEATTGHMRVLVDRVAELVLDGKAPSLPDISAELSISTHEALGLMHDLNTRLRTAGGPMALVLAQLDPEPKPDDRTDFDHRLLMMSIKHAARVRDN